MFFCNLNISNKKTKNDHYFSIFNPPRATKNGLGEKKTQSIQIRTALLRECI